MLKAAWFISGLHHLPSFKPELHHFDSPNINIPLKEYSEYNDLVKKKIKNGLRIWDTYE